MTEIDSRLHSKVNDLQRMVVDLDHSLGAVGQQVAEVGQEQHETRSELAVLRSEFADFVRTNERNTAIQLAETRIGVLQDELQIKYGHHDVVRRSATGILQAFDVGLVSEETVQTSTEQLMMQAPRYWLAPVLVALARWATDDQEGCRRAVEEAFRRSPDKTSLFMALVLRRQGRQASAVRWLRHYLNAQDPAALGRDFAVILECISHGAFGPAGVEVMQTRLESWRTQLLNDEDILATQIGHWRTHLDNQVGDPVGDRFPRLKAVSPQWPQMERILAQAAAHQSILTTYAALMDEEPEPLDRLEDAVDDILDLLVGDFEKEELPSRRELELNLAIKEHHGDVGRARQAVDADGRALETTLDYLTIQTRSALNPDAIGVSKSTQRIAIAACHEWFAQAHASFTKDYRLLLPSSVEAVFGTGHSSGAQTFRLPKWTGSFTLPMETLERSLGRHWDQHGKAHVDQFAFDWKRRAMLPACVMAVVLFVVSIAAGIGPGLIVTGLGGGIWAMVLFNQYLGALRQQQQATEFIARAKRDSLAQLRSAGAELVDWTSEYAESDRQETQVQAMIAQLATAGHAATPFERRTVSLAESRGA